MTSAEHLETANPKLSKLFLKFLVILVSVFLATLIPSVYFLVQLDTRNHEEALASRIGNQAARVASALQRHGTDPTSPIVQDLLAPLAADHAFVCLELRNRETGRLLTAKPDPAGCKTHLAASQFSIGIGGSSKAVLVVHFSNDEVLESRNLLQTLIFSVVGIGFVVAAASATFGFQLTVSRPLGRLLVAIRKNSETGERTTVGIVKNDEIGVLTQAFNDMFEHEAAREYRLVQVNNALRSTQNEFRELNEELEKRVFDRTKALAEREAALAISEKRFKDFATASSDWYWEMDENLRFSYFSDRFTEVTGVEPSLLMGKTREETGVPGATPEQWQNHLNALHGRKPFRDFVHSRTKQDGSTVWLAINGIPCFDENGVFIGFRGTGSDITKNVQNEFELREAKEILEKRVEERTADLRRSEARLRDAIETISEGFALYDADERLIMCNEPYRKTLPRTSAHGLLEPGTKLEEMIRDGIGSGYLPPKYKDGEEYLAARLDAFRNPPGPFEFETSNGHWVRVEERKTSEGGTVAIRTNITKRKQAEAAVQESEERIRNIINNSPSAIFMKDLDGRYILANRKFSQWFDVEPADVVGKEPADFFPNDTAEKGEAQDREVIEEKRAVEWEADVTITDNALRKIHFNKFPVFGAGGDIVGIGVIGTDVTERNATEEQLRQAQKMEAVGQLTGGVAHDFNNLLGVIIGNLEFLQETIGEDPDKQELAATAVQAALHGAELTKRLLAFSRKQPLRPVVVNINALLQNMTDLLQRTLGETIKVRTIAQSDLRLVEIDSGQLETAVVNLAINARQAMPDGGSLTIETRNVELNGDTISSRVDLDPGDYAMLAVSDTGSGMLPEVLEHAFDPFFTTKQAGEGSGLGLSMVHGFVKQSGGDVSIYSEPGEGTTVKLFFPGSDTSARQTQKHTEAATMPRGFGETVLIVEDDDDLRKLAIRIISDLGYKVEAAADGPSALDILRRNRSVDVLFTDIVLPNGMNGVELASAAKDERPNIQILYNSGYTQNAILQNGIVDQGITLLDKPYRRREVAERLRQILDDIG